MLIIFQKMSRMEIIKVLNLDQEYERIKYIQYECTIHCH